jgi:hypothetical protein
MTKGVVRVVFGDGPLGLDLLFVEGVAIMVSKVKGQAATNGIKVGDLVVELNGTYEYSESDVCTAQNLATRAVLVY